MSENTAPNVESIEALFVQSAHGLTSNNGSVTFHGLAHATLFFLIGPKGCGSPDFQEVRRSMG
jgi:hypothetical protein